VRSEHFSVSERFSFITDANFFMKILYTTYAMYINQKAGIHVMYVYYIATEQYKFSVLFCFFLSLLTLSSNPLKYTANILSMLRLNSCRL